MKKIKSIYRLLFERRELIYEMVIRELRDRHAGQVLGMLWAFGYPLLLMIMYMVLFAYVFPTRISGGAPGSDFSVNIFAGIVSWLAFQDLLSKSAMILTGHSNLVKQIVFPTEILPVKTALASIVPYSASILFAILFAAYKGTISWLCLTLPLLILFQLIAMTGVAYLLSVAGVFLKDIREIVSVFCAINLFAQPILYNPYNIPDFMNWVFLINPFSYVVWCWQDALYYGSIQHPVAWVVFPAGCIFILLAGYTVFIRMKPLYGDAL